MDNLKLEKLAGMAFEKYPKVYKDYLLEELKVVSNFISGCKVLDVGCGSDLFVEKIASKTKEYVGIENDGVLIYDIKDRLGSFKNCKVLNLDVHKISQSYPSNYFDISIATWNAIGCEGDETHWLSEVAKVTKGKIFLSLVEKGHIEIRQKYYEDLNSSYMVMDDGKETIFSPIWGYARAFSKEDIEDYAKECKLKVEKFMPLAKIGLLAILSKK